MEKNREELLQKLFKEMILTFRALKPSHGHEGHHPHFDHQFGRGHMDLFWRLMKEKEGISVKDLAQSLNITSGAITQIVDKLVEKKFVERQVDPNDRRSLLIKLSTKARSKIDSFKKGFLEKVSPKFNSLTDAELKTLIDLLGKITASSVEG